MEIFTDFKWKFRQGLKIDLQKLWMIIFRDSLHLSSLALATQAASLQKSIVCGDDNVRYVQQFRHEYYCNKCQEKWQNSGTINLS
jgi:hypothetical protein